MSRDYRENYADVNIKFTTRSGETPFTLAGTPVVSVYKSNSTTQSVVGVTLTVDFDGLTGLNNVKIDLADAFYATAEDYSLVITTGTVDGISVVGEVVGNFSIENSAAFVAMRGTDNSLLAASVNVSAGIVESNIKQIDGITGSADNLEASASTIVKGLATAGTLSITQMSTNLAEATDDHFIGRVVTWTSGTLKDQATDITDYTGAGGDTHLYRPN